MAFLDRAGARIWYEAAGDGPAVVFLHAGLMDSRMWAEEAAALAPAFRTVRLDCRGYGRSEPPREPYEPHEDVRALLDELSIERAALVGCSMGGKIAIDLTLAHPDRVWALVPVASGLSGFSFRAYDDDQTARAEAAWERRDVAALAELWLEVWAPLGDEGTIGAIARDNAKVFALDDLERDLDPPAAARLHEIRAPVLAVVGDHEVTGVVEICQKIEREVVGARLEVLEGCDHLVNLRAPREFGQLLREFLVEHAV